jgi:hypothetical protein
VLGLAANGSRPSQRRPLPNPLPVDQLDAHLRQRLGGRVRNLRVLLTDNGLVLRGQATTYYAKQLAQHALMDASNLPIRANEIEVV